MPYLRERGQMLQYTNYRKARKSRVAAIHIIFVKKEDYIEKRNSG